MRRRPAPSSGIHLRIGRIVVDSAVLGDASREQLHGDIGTAISQYLSGEVAKGPPTLARHIAESVAPQVHAQLPSKGGRDGAS